MILVDPLMEPKPWVVLQCLQCGGKIVSVPIVEESIIKLCTTNMLGNWNYWELKKEHLLSDNFFELAAAMTPAYLLQSLTIYKGVLSP